MSVLWVAILSSFVFADCKYEEGDDIITKGKYQFTATCKIHGTVEKANKKCTKVKVRVAKITGPFGITVDEVCSYSTGKASAGEVVWMSVN